MSVKSPLLNSPEESLLPFDVCILLSLCWYIVYVLAQIAVASDRLSKQWW